MQLGSRSCSTVPFVGPIYYATASLGCATVTMTMQAAATTSAAIEIKTVNVRDKRELERFLHVPWTLGMPGDPRWVPPLLDDQRRMLDPDKSPFCKHGEVVCFLAQ